MLGWLSLCTADTARSASTTTAVIRYFPLKRVTHPSVTPPRPAYSTMRGKTSSRLKTAGSILTILCLPESTCSKVAFEIVYMGEVLAAAAVCNRLCLSRRRASIPSLSSSVLRRYSQFSRVSRERSDPTFIKRSAPCRR